MDAELIYHETQMGHAIDPRLLPEAEQWVQDVASREG
jgi:hypothetical protein